MCVDDRSDDLERQSLGGGIHREHASLRGAVFFVAEIDELAGLQLAAVKKAYVAADEQHVTFVDRAIQKRLAWPRGFDHPAVVA